MLNKKEKSIITIFDVVKAAMYEKLTVSRVLDTGKAV